MTSMSDQQNQNYRVASKTEIRRLDISALAERVFLALAINSDMTIEELAVYAFMAAGAFYQRLDAEAGKTQGDGSQEEAA